MPSQPEAAVLAFFDAINEGDVEALLALMTDDHLMRIEDEPPVSGRNALRAAWRGYFDAFASYCIYVDRLVVERERVVLLGSTTGSHLGLPDDRERDLPVVWTAEVREGRLSSWNILADSPETRRELGLA